MLKTSISDRMMAALRLLFLTSIAVSVLPNGSVGDNAYYVSVSLSGLVFAATALVGFRSCEVSRLYKTALFLVVLSIAYVALQALSFSGNPLANPAWETAAPEIGAGYGSISIAPAASIAAIPALISPFIVFMTTLILHQNDHAARDLWRRLALFGAGVAVIALGRHLWFPSAALFGTPAADTPSLTGNFFNRNNAAAFFALVAFAMLGLLLVQMTRFNLESVRQRAKTFRFFDRRKYVVFLVYILLFFITLIALFLTQSRAGVGLSLLLLAATTIIVALTSKTTSFGISKRIGFASLIGAGSFAAFIFFGGRTILRVELGGFDEVRWCVSKATLAAIGEFPFFGTGFGTYREISPIYRNVDCGIYGMWDRAHNTFLEGYLGLGIFFLILLLICTFTLIITLRSGYLERHRFRFVSIVAGGAVIYIALHSMVDFPLQIPGIASYFSALIGAGCSIALARQRKT